MRTPRNPHPLSRNKKSFGQTLCLTAGSCHEHWHIPAPGIAALGAPSVILGYSGNNPYCKRGLACKTHSNMREEALWAGHTEAKEQRHPSSPSPFVVPPGVPSATLNETGGQVSDWHPAGDKEQKLLPTPGAGRAQPCFLSREG